MKKIKYLVHYENESDEGRSAVFPTIKRVDYISGKLSKMGYSTEIISACLTSTNGYFRGSKQRILNNVELIKLPAFKWGNTLQKITAYVWSKVGLFFYLITHIKRNENFIIFHSLAFMDIVKLVKKIKKFNLIIDVGEIYSDLVDRQKTKQQEMKFFRYGDKYIFANEMLKEMINDSNKPYGMLYGTYQVEPDRHESYNDGKIHIVYAGVLDAKKNGAQAAVACAEFLPENYHVHILGFGSQKEIEDIKNLILKTKGKTKSTITYDGTRSGEEYIRYIQKCQIGLATQAMNEKFSNTSFQSKILSYMANGLRVVTARIPITENSGVGRDMYYYNEHTPQAIAKAIVNIDFNDEYDGRKIIEKLDKKFCVDLENLLKK